MMLDSSNLKLRNATNTNRRGEKEKRRCGRRKHTGRTHGIEMSKEGLESTGNKNQKSASFRDMMRQNYQRHLETVKSLRRELSQEQGKIEDSEEKVNLNGIKDNVEMETGAFDLEEQKEIKFAVKEVKSGRKVKKGSVDRDSDEGYNDKWGICRNKLKITQAGFLESLEKQNEFSLSGQKEKQGSSSNQNCENNRDGSLERTRKRKRNCENNNEVEKSSNLKTFKSEKLPLCFQSFKNLELASKNSDKSNCNVVGNESEGEVEQSLKKNQQIQSNKKKEIFISKIKPVNRDSLKSNNKSETLTYASETSQITFNDSNTSQDKLLYRSKPTFRINLENPTKGQTFIKNISKTFVKNSKLRDNKTKTPICYRKKSQSQFEARDFSVNKVFISFRDWQGLFKNYSIPAKYSHISLKEFRLRILLELDRQFPEKFDIGYLAKHTELAYMFENLPLIKFKKCVLWLREKTGSQEKVPVKKHRLTLCSFLTMPVFNKDKPQSQFHAQTSRKSSIEQVIKKLEVNYPKLCQAFTSEHNTLINFDLKRHSRSLIRVLAKELGPVLKRIKSQEQDCIFNETPQYSLDVFEFNGFIFSQTETLFARAAISAQKFGGKKSNPKSIPKEKRKSCQVKTALRSGLLISYPNLTVPDFPISKVPKICRIKKTSILRRLKRYKIEGVLLREQTSAVNCRLSFRGKQIVFSRRFWFFDQTVESIATRDLLRVFQTADAFTFVKMYISKSINIG